MSKKKHTPDRRPSKFDSDDWAGVEFPRSPSNRAALLRAGWSQCPGPGGEVNCNSYLAPEAKHTYCTNHWKLNQQQPSKTSRPPATRKGRRRG